MTIQYETFGASPKEGNGVNTDFPSNGLFENAGEMKVTHTDSNGVITTLTDGVHFTYSGYGAASGSVTYPKAGSGISILPSSEYITIAPDLPFTQLVDLVSQGKYRPEVAEQVADNIVRLIQQLRDNAGRAMVLPPGTPTDFDKTLPSPGATKLFGYSYDGKSISLYDLIDSIFVNQEAEPTTDGSLYLWQKTSTGDLYHLKSGLWVLSAGIVTVLNKAEAKLIEPTEGASLIILSDDGAGRVFKAVTGLTGQADNGGDYCGTQIAFDETAVWRADNYATGIINGVEFGLKGDGITNMDVPFAAAIAHLESLGGGTLHLNAGIYLKGLIQNVKAPIKIIGAGNGEDSTGQTSTSDGITSFKALPALTGFHMFVFRSATAGNYLSGCCMKNVKFMLQGIAGSIKLDRVESSIFENIYAASSNGTWVTTNMLLINGCRFNYFENLYLSGTNECDVLQLEGQGTYAGCTQNVFNRVTLGYGAASGTGVEGALVLNGDVDNNIFYHTHCINGNVLPGVSGTYGLVLKNGGSHARNNSFYYFIGHVKAQSLTRGNNILDLGAETGSVTIDAGGQLNYNVKDNATGGIYQTQRLALTENKDITLGSMQIIPGSVSSPVNGSFSVSGGEGRFPTIDFSSTNNEALGFNLSPPDNWSSGEIAGLNLFFSSDIAGGPGADEVRVELLIAVHTATAGGTPFSPDKTETFTVNVSQTSGSYLHKAAAIFSSAQAFTAGENISVRITRVGGDAADTFTGKWQLMSAQLLFTATGPDSGGVGPWAQGVIGTN